MSQMIYRHGSMKKWKGIGYDWKIIEETELGDHLSDGWCEHPDKLTQEITGEHSAPQHKKPGPKPKVKQDASD